MKKFLMMLMVVLCSSVFFVNDADAKRVGGGRSVGKQNNTVQNEAMPAQRQNATPGTPAQQNPAAATSGARRWAGPLAGLAAGLGLAALASALGFGEGFAVFLLILLMGLVVLIAVRMFMARSQANRAAAAGAGAAGGTGAFRANAPQQGMNREAMPQPMAPQAAVGGAAAGAAAAMAQPVLPAGFDAEAFVRQAKVQFVRLQAAFDTKNVDDLREFTSPEMFGELNIDLMQRGDAVQNTDVVELDARLLGVQEEGVMQMASVYFSGMIREEADAAAERFEEIWNFTRPASGASGWVLAGIQQV